MSTAVSASRLRAMAETSGLLRRPTSLSDIGPDNLLYLAIQTALIHKREIARLERKIERIRAVVNDEFGDEDA